MRRGPNSSSKVFAFTMSTALAIALALGLAAGTRAQLGSVELQLPGQPGPSGWLFTDDGRLQVLVELSGAPAARAYAAQLGEAGLSRAQAKANAIAAGRAQAQANRAAQDRVASAIAALNLNTSEIYRVQKAYNGIALAVDARRWRELLKVPGVQAVHPLVPEYPSNAESVPFIGAPHAWDNTVTPAMAAGVTGTGIKVGIIDSGIDYMHPNFGGTGVLGDYQTGSTNTAGFTTAPSSGIGAFPTSKVAGGTDFAGDAYKGNNAPVPDANPMDCGGHGSHVAGTVAGLGVTPAGATYTGPYDSPSAANYLANLRIGPGVAPGAQLYALRVFGCGGSTGLVVQAIDWAMDPNGDLDLSDHLDVINMSLGSDNGSISDTSAAAAENAAAAGVIVVAASGNAGDTFFITSSPAISGRTISAAASTGALAGAVLTVNTPAGIAGNYAVANNGFVNNPVTPAPPAPAGQTAGIVLVQSTTGVASQGCGATYSNAGAVSGNIALIDRGTCGFEVKVQNAQANGAIAAIVVNNATGDPNLTVMGCTTAGGCSPAITIPAVFLSQADGATIKAQLGGGVNATLAAANAGDQMAGFSSRGPGGGGGPIRLKPDITAPGVNTVSTETGRTCTGTAPSTGCIWQSATGYNPGGLAGTLSGTSMATPHTAGVLALLRQEHPDWSVEELKALAMNGSLHDLFIGAARSGLKYGVGRVGAGRVDVASSAAQTVTAFNADEPGLVSLSFDTEVVGTLTQVKKVRLVNHGAADQAYTMSIDVAQNDAPGVAFSLPGGTSVTVPAGGSVTVDVRMDATANQMRHSREATVAPTQAAPGALAALGNLNRHWLTEEGGYLILSQGGNPKLRVPLYAAAHPNSNMFAAPTIATGGAGSGSTTLALTGQDVCTGTLGAGPTCTTTYSLPTFDEVSLVSPFELQVSSPRDAANLPAYADIQYGGVAYWQSGASPSTSADRYLFGVSSWGPWSSPTDVVYDICVDTNNDGTYDRILFNSNPGTMSSRLFGSSGTGQDSFLIGVFNTATNGVSITQFVNLVSGAGIDSRLFDNNVMFLPATPAQLGLAAAGGAFRYRIVTCPGFSPLCAAGGADKCTPAVNSFYDEAAGPFTWNRAAQGLNFGPGWLSNDLNGGTLPVSWNTANMTANGSLGALLLHHHNGAGRTAQVVALEGTLTADLAITKSVNVPAPTLGTNVVFTITVNGDPTNDTLGVVVTDLLPAGLTYVSDDGGGAYNSTTGQWTVGSLTHATSKTLHVTATAASTDQQCNTAQITSSQLLDTNPANNQATVCVNAAHSADLVLTGVSTSGPTVLAGHLASVQLVLNNAGVDPAYGVGVNTSWNQTVTPSGTPTAGTFNAGTGLWSLGSVAVKKVIADSALPLTVTAPNCACSLTLTGTAGGSTNDPNTANNTALVTIQVLSPAIISGSTKTVTGSFQEGGMVTYTVTLPNTGTNDQQDNPGDEFTDVLPPALALQSAFATAGTAVADTTTNTVHWNGVIPAGGSVTITITAIVNTGFSGQLVSNQGTVFFDADGNGTNESSALTDDPSVGGATDPTTFRLAAIAQIPTLSEVGLVALALVLAAGALLFLRRRTV